MKLSPVLVHCPGTRASRYVGWEHHRWKNPSRKSKLCEEDPLTYPFSWDALLFNGESCTDAGWNLLTITLLHSRKCRFPGGNVVFKAALWEKRCHLRHHFTDAAAHWLIKWHECYKVCTNPNPWWDGERHKFRAKHFVKWKQVHEKRLPSLINRTKKTFW